MDARYTELAGRIGLGQSPRIPKLFQIIASPEEADILLALPGDAPTVAGKLRKTEDEVASALQVLFVKGVAFPSTRTQPPTYKMCRDMVQFHDASILWPDAPQEYPGSLGRVHGR